MDYQHATDAEVDAFLTEHRQEMDADGLEPGDVLAALSAGRAVLERRAYGLAVIQLKKVSDPRTGQNGLIPHLWLLWIDPQTRGLGLGRRFVRELLKLHARGYHMSLVCNGARRRAFFGRLGFRVVQRDGECRTMTTNDQRF